MGRLTVGIQGNLRRTQDIRGGDSPRREVSHGGVTTAVGFSGAELSTDCSSLGGVPDYRGQAV